ncbi:DUF1425 domain-containing protein [Rouxiella silvae]|uniref:DUF1425 domain-containing protein n=1 Tax=Rouxiella silvae TaxID=1646373 RepID=A0AA40X670_9GAMM|nr:DUF1425 domain-containing protein [Rouxiella silvae]MBF6639323.1 DUF1425 domain-containing protein [Rouxiella silvae]
MRFLMACAVMLCLAGCSSKPGIALNNQQTVIMESPVLTAGIIPGTPSLSVDQGRQKATLSLSNNQPKAIQIHYVFYWYDKQGLDLLPFAAPRTITVPANSDVDIYSLNGNLDAYSVRVHLYL